MKIEIEIEPELLWDTEAECQSAPFCVTATRIKPYYDNDNYTREEKEYDVLRDDTMDGLYEKMGEAVVANLLYGERQCKQNQSSYPADGWEVEFSPIFVEVQQYSPERMRGSKSFREVGLAREQQRNLELAEQEAARIRTAKWTAEQREKHDREEYQRLQKKFGAK